MKLHYAGIAAAALAVIILAGCQQTSQTRNLSVSSNLQIVFSDSSNADHLSSAGNEPTFSERGSEPLTDASSETHSQAFAHRSSIAVSSEHVSSKRSDPPAAASTNQKPPVTSSGVSSIGKTSSAQEPSEPETPKEKDPYAYPFDIEEIKKDLIVYGESLGMKHRTHYSDGTEVTPDNGSYELPTYLSKSSTAWIIKKSLYEQLDYHFHVYQAEVFTIYIESFGNSEYQIYSIYA